MGASRSSIAGDFQVPTDRFLMLRAARGQVLVSIWLLPIEWSGVAETI